MAQQIWPADKVERRPLASLKAAPVNARTHSDAQIEQISASMRQWGWTAPILVDEDGILIAGHGRVAAARKLGLTEAPVMVATGWTEAQKRAYALADNQIALNAGWDLDTLKSEVQGLAEWDFDLELLGFENLDELLQAPTGGLTDADDVPPIPEIPVSAAGDLWVLGRHRLICGDCTVEAVVERLLNGVKPHLMVTDPPYGVEYDPNWRNSRIKSNGKAVGGRAIGKVENDNRADWRAAWALFPGDVSYIWHSGLHSHSVYESLVASGFSVRAQIIWAKSNAAIGRGHYHWAHEPCFYAVREGKTGHWTGGRNQSTVWQIAKPMKSETGHSTQKPVECMKRPIENNSSPGQAVYEPFSGSGTTIIACESTGRQAFAIELNPAYVDVAVKRWQEFTGEAAKLDGSGKTFAAVASERAAARAA